MNTVKMVDPTDVLWKRIGAFLIDVIIPAVIGAILWLFLPRFVPSIIVFVLVIANSVVLQGVTGASVGKHLVGIRTVDAEGKVCGVGKAFVRWLMWIVDAFPYCLPLVGFITFFSSKEHQRVGDRVAKTYVVDKQYAGSPPFAMAFPSDPDQPPYRVSTMSPYQSGPINAPHAAPGTVHEEPQAEGAPTGYEASPAKPGNEPVWDPDRGAYVRWDARHNTWLAFDEETREWRPTA